MERPSLVSSALDELFRWSMLRLDSELKELFSKIEEFELDPPRPANGRKPGVARYTSFSVRAWRLDLM